MYTLIPQLIIILALVGIIVIVARKFPELAKTKNQTYAQNKRRASIVQRSFTKVISFSVNIVRTVFTKIVKIRDLKKNKIIQEKKEQEIKKLVSNKKIPDINKKKNKINPHVQAIELLTQNKFNEAEKTYLNLIQKNPKDTKAYKGLGIIYLKQKNLNDAQASFEQVLKLSPNDFKIQAELQKIKNMKK